MPKFPKFSVVIPLMEQAGHHKNRQGNIEALLDCIDHQTYTDYEIVLVEQYEEAPFYDYLEDRVHIYQPIKGMPFRVSWCRNVGVKQANGKIMFFIDADMVFDTDYFQIVSQRVLNTPNFKYTKGFSNLAWLTGCGRAEYLKSGYKRQWKKPYLYKYAGRAPCGGATLFDIDFFLKELGGFLENFHTHGGQEKTLFVRAGTLYRMSSAVNYVLLHLYHSWSFDPAGRLQKRKRPKRLDDSYSVKSLVSYVKTHRKTVTKSILEAGIGNLDHPTILQFDRSKKEK